MVGGGEGDDKEREEGDGKRELGWGGEGQA